MQRGLAGGGEPLPPPLRQLAESNLGVPLSQVRLHRNGVGASVAQRFNAHAITTGNIVALGRGHADLSSHQAQRTLGHELVHVAQVHKRGVGSKRAVSLRSDAAEREANRIGPDVLGGTRRLQVQERPAAPIQREDGPMCESEPSSSEPQVCADPGMSGGTSSTVAAMTQGPSFDPEAVNVGEMTNETLNSESVRVDDWLRGHGRTEDPDVSAYTQLAHRLRREREGRVRAGHWWMARAERTMPTRLIQLVPGQQARVNIMLADLAMAYGRPDQTLTNPIMTEDQFRQHLSARGIPTIDYETYLQRTGRGRSGAEAGGEPGAETQVGEVGSRSTGAAQDIGPLAPPGGTFDLADPAFAGTLAVTQGRLYRGAFDIRAQGAFAQRPMYPSGQVNWSWVGRMGELGYQSQAREGFGLLLEDLNQRPWVDRNGRLHQPTERNFPIFDFERGPNSRGFAILGARRISVKASLGATPAARYSYYRTGLTQMLDAGATTSALESYIRNQPGQQGATAGTAQYEVARSQVLTESYIAVNADDVAGFRALLADPATQVTSTRPWLANQGPTDAWLDPDYRRVYEGVMRENPVTVGSQTFDSPAALDNARATMTPEQYTEARRQVGRRAARRVVSSGVTTTEIRNMGAERMGAPGTLSEADLARMVTSEYVASSRRGGGVGGELSAAGRSGAQGAGVGGVIAVFTTAGVMLLDEADHPNWESELGTSGGLGALGGGTGAAAEQLIISSGTRYMIGREGATALTPGALRFLGRSGGAGVGAGAVELFSMAALEEREHSGLEVGVRTTRAVGMGIVATEVGVEAGAFAVILTTAAVGAAGGSVAPGVGTAIGFIVGLGVGALTYYVLDQTVPGGREDWESGERPQQLRPVIGPALREMRDRLEAQSRLYTHGDDFAGGSSEDALPMGYGLRSDERDQCVVPPH